MQGYEAGFSELRTADGQNAFRPVHTSVEVSVALQCRAKPRTILSRAAHSQDVCFTFRVAHSSARLVVIRELCFCSRKDTKSGNTAPCLASLHPKLRRMAR